MISGDWYRYRFPGVTSPVIVDVASPLFFKLNIHIDFESHDRNVLCVGENFINGSPCPSFISCGGKGLLSQRADQ